jgi:hypothetical protein
MFWLFEVSRPPDILLFLILLVVAHEVLESGDGGSLGAKQIPECWLQISKKLLRQVFLWTQRRQWNR